MCGGGGVCVWREFNVSRRVGCFCSARREESRLLTYYNRRAVRLSRLETRILNETKKTNNTKRERRNTLCPQHTTRLLDPTGVS